MDWRYNSIWFDQLEQKKVFEKDYKEKGITTENIDFSNSEYVILWHLKEGTKAFDNVKESDKLKYLELNWANVKTFVGIEKFKNLKRLELHYCTKLENDIGISVLNDKLEFFHINQSKKFKFTEELLQLKNLKVLCLNSCGSIENLNFLNYFPKLIDFRFVDTNVLDGNLNPILVHPTLRTVSFLNKKHFNFKYENIRLELDVKFQNDFKTIANRAQYSTYRYDYD